MIHINVRLHTILQRQTNQGLIDKVEVSLPIGSTMQDLLDYLRVELSPDALLLVINGIVADEETRLKDNDIINLMPAISGGESERLYF